MAGAIFDESPAFKKYMEQEGGITTVLKTMDNCYDYLRYYAVMSVYNYMKANYAGLSDGALVVSFQIRLIIRLFQNTLTSMTNTAIGLFSICAPKTEWDQMSCLSGRLNTMMSKRYYATASNKPARRLKPSAALLIQPSRASGNLLSIM